MRLGGANTAGEDEEVFSFIAPMVLVLELRGEGLNWFSLMLIRNISPSLTSYGCRMSRNWK